MSKNNETKPLKQHAVMRCFSVHYSFNDDKYETVGRFYGTDRDDCRNRFWEKQKDATRIHSIDEVK